MFYVLLKKMPSVPRRLYERIAERTKSLIRGRSIRFRINAFYIAFFGCILILFSGLLYKGFVVTQQNVFDAALYNYATDISRNVDVSAFGRVSIEKRVLFDQRKVFPFLVSDSMVQILSRRGRVLARSNIEDGVDIPLIVDDLLTVEGFQTSFHTVWIGSRGGRAYGSTYRMVSLPLKADLDTDLVLQVLVPVDPIEHQKRQLILLFLFAIPTTLFIGAVGGLYLSRRALAPVSTLIEKSGQISASDLSERLPVPRANDELRRLSLTLNSLLNRLQRAFEGQNRFVSDASHQLRTPLAILRGELDVLKRRPRSVEEYALFCESASQELDHLSRMVNDLLLLARVDTGQQSLEFSQVHLDEVVTEVLSRYEWVASQKQVHFHMDLIHKGAESENQGFEIRGDSDLVRTMVQNLIENAVKFADAGSVIAIALESDVTEVLLKVTNTGEPIPTHQQAQIFDRFYRAHPQAQREIPGLGLGLAIVRQIVDAHQARIEVNSSSSQRVTTFSVGMKNF